MFKSKKFTIAFSILAVVNVALMIFLITLLPKKSSGEDFNGYQISTGSQENTVPQPT